jgi:hypothetical protein
MGIILNTLATSRFFKAEDIGPGRTLTIKEVTFEKVGDGDKPCCHFKETTKALVLNKTNIDLLVTLHGEDTDEWVGQRVGLKLTPVEFQGRRVNGIRVCKPHPVLAARPDDDVDF